MRPGSDAERSPLMRALVFLWVGQNVLLVVSSILRLDLYVEIYLLTYWRVAAFIWMLIVAAGLDPDRGADRDLSLQRLAGRRQSRVLALTIYVCSFVNFAESGRELQRRPQPRPAKPAVRSISTISWRSARRPFPRSTATSPPIRRRT